MGFRNSGVRVLLLLIIGVLAWYTFSLYHDLYRNFTVKGGDPVAAVTSPVKEVKSAEGAEGGETKDDKSDIKVDDPDNLINKEILKKAEDEWSNSKAIPDASSRAPCSSTKCESGEFNFKIISGAANVIGPSICFNDTILMKNSLNNVDRGMNIARVNGISGKLEKFAVFDLYSKDSTDLKAFVKELEDHHLVLISSYDDAASRLDDEARSLLENLGSKKSKSLSFRDNWIFVGGKTLEKPYEGHMPNNREVNKYGDWPGAITIEGCVPILSQTKS